MEQGLLWFDKDPQRRLVDKVGQAATRYHAKFGQLPTICYLNSADFDGQTDQVNGIRLRTASNILRHHFWIGVENEVKMAKAA